MSSEQQNPEEEVTCPACQGAGGVDAGAGFLSGTLCRDEGVVELAKAEEYERDIAQRRSI